MNNSYKFFSNKNCKYFPCHKGIKEDEFNCLFCFCPLYALGDKCGGNFFYNKNNIKDCSKCTIPHQKEGYEYILSKISHITRIAQKNKKYQLDTYIFDLDGVIINSALDIASSVNYALENMGYEPKSTVLISSYIGHGTKKLISKSFNTQDKSIIEKGLILFREHYMNSCINETTLREGIVDVLYLLRDENIALLTQKPWDMTIKILKHFDIFKYFNIVLTPEKVTRPKPFPDGINQIIDFFGTDKNRCVMIGDSKADIDAAKSANVLKCAVLSGIGDLKDIKADIYIDSLKELIEYFYL